MKNFPTMCIDGFYEDPDAVRDLALSMEYFPTNGDYPGVRTKLLNESHPKFFNAFCEKLFSVYYDYTSQNVNWVVATGFQVINKFEDNPDSFKNKGWIHKDSEDILMAGVIYLTPDADPDTGTSTFRIINSSTIDHSDIKNMYYKSGVDAGYDNAIQQHNSSFVETARFNNVYNRMISFDSDTYHGVNSFYDVKPRLTQVFFVKKLDYVNTPLQRVREIKIMR